MADPLFSLIKDWGWGGVVLFLVVEKILPFIKESVVPELRADREAMRKVETTERARLRDLEERQVQAFDRVAAAVENLTVSMVLINEKITRLNAGLEIHDREVTAAIADMRAKTGVTTGRGISVRTPEKESKLDE